MRLGFPREFLALQLDLEYLVDFDDLVTNIFDGVDVNYVLFTDIDFKRVIEFADRLNIVVDDISVSTPDGMLEKKCEDEMNTHATCRNHKAILQAIHDNELSVRNISIIFNNNNKLKIYNSSIVCTEDVDLAESVELQNLLKEILKITKGIFTDY
jgi:hypothetical protein